MEIQHPVNIDWYKLASEPRRLIAHPSGQTYIKIHIWDRHTDRHTYGTDIQTDTHIHLWDRHTDRHIWPVKNSFYARNFFVCAPIPGLGFFQTPRMHGESVHVLRFKIGPKTEAGGRTVHSN